MNDTSFAAMLEEIEGLGGTDVEKNNELNINTKLVHGYHSIDEKTGAVSPPLFQSTTFAHPEFGNSTGYCYSRCGNPTRLLLEDTIAMLEGGKKAFAYSSGMMAIATLLKLLKTGDHVLVSDDLYGGTYRLFTDIYSGYGIEFSYCNTSSIANVQTSIKSNTRLIFIETPTNPSMKIADISQLAALAHAHNALLAVDNTFLTFYYQKPFEFGADIVVYSGTKYLCGHNDCTAGFLVLREPDLIEPIYTATISEGGLLAPFECWLMIRSLKTLAVRLERQSANAQAIVKFLQSHEHVVKVLYPGTEDNSSAVSKKQSSGCGAMISFYVDTPERAVNVINTVRLILFAESLGGVESLITYPRYQTHSAMPESILDTLGINDCLLRLSVGLENVGDLIQDLDQALM